MKNVFLISMFILSLYMFSYVRETYLDNDFLRDNIFILETEISQKDSLINSLQKDNFILNEKLREKTILKKQKKIKRVIDKPILTVVKDTIINTIDTLSN